MKSAAQSLWFDKNGEEAVRFYTSLFKDGKIGLICRYPEKDFPDEMMGQIPGSVAFVEFSFAGLHFVAINGGDFEGGRHNFSHSIILHCETQDEIDHYWNALIKNGGKEVQCGWLTDRYGISWQIVPAKMRAAMADPNPQRAERAWQAHWKSIKLNVKDYE